MEIKEAYVDFSTAKLLKEKGFDEMTDMEYNKDGELLSNRLCGYDGEKHICVMHHNLFPYPAPTQQMTMRWLREVHGLFIQIGNDDLDYWWQVQDVVNKDEFGDPVSKTPSYGGSETYELAVESALNYCLKNLI